MSNNRLPMQVALTGVPLFRPQGASPAVLTAIADVTGIPASTLEAAERRMARTGSLASLVELFKNPAVPKTDGLRYELTVNQEHKGVRGGSREQVVQRLTLAVASAKGQVVVRLTVVLNRRCTTTHVERQSAQICLSYKIDAGQTHQAFRHEMTIAGDRPRLGGAYAPAA